MNHAMTREQKKKLLLAEGALYRFECMHARRAVVDELSSITHRGPTGMLRAVSGRGLLSLAATALPLLLGAGRVARVLKRGILVAGGVAAAWSAISRWREQAADEGAATPPEKAAAKASEAAPSSADGAADA